MYKTKNTTYTKPLLHSTGFTGTRSSSLVPVAFRKENSELQECSQGAYMMPQPNPENKNSCPPEQRVLAPPLHLPPPCHPAATTVIHKGPGLWCTADDCKSGSKASFVVGLLKLCGKRHLQETLPKMAGLDSTFHQLQHLHLRRLRLGPDSRALNPIPPKPFGED